MAAVVAGRVGQVQAAEVAADETVDASTRWMTEQVWVPASVLRSARARVRK